MHRPAQDQTRPTPLADVRAREMHHNMTAPERVLWSHLPRRPLERPEVQAATSGGTLHRRLLLPRCRTGGWKSIVRGMRAMHGECTTKCRPVVCRARHSNAAHFGVATRTKRDWCLAASSWLRWSGYRRSAASRIRMVGETWPLATCPLRPCSQSLARTPPPPGRGRSVRSVPHRRQLGCSPPASSHPPPSDPVR